MELREVEKGRKLLGKYADKVEIALAVKLATDKYIYFNNMEDIQKWVDGLDYFTSKDKYM